MDLALNSSFQSLTQGIKTGLTATNLSTLRTFYNQSSRISDLQPVILHIFFYIQSLPSSGCVRSPIPRTLN